MKVTAVFHGILYDWVGVEKADFEIHEGALFADLLSEICKAYRQKMPDQLWNDEKNVFNKPVLAFSNEKQIKGPREPLSNGQKIQFYLMLAGG